MSAVLAKKEKDFFNDVYQLMKAKYPEMSEKFGIWKKQKHFELAADECLLETTDEATRVSTTRIVKKKDLPEKYTVTTWSLSKEGPISEYICLTHDFKQCDH